MRRTFPGLCLAALAVPLSAALADGPSSRLGVSPSGHYMTLDGRTIALVGDSGTHCVMQNANIDYRRWIDDCVERGLTAVHIWSFVAPRQHVDGSVVEDRYGYVYPGLTPWARRDGGPTAADGLPMWDLTRFDEDGYWPRLRDLCAYAAECDLVLGITVFFGWPKHQPDWLYHPLNVRNGGPVEDDGQPITQAQVIHSPGTEVLDEPWSDEWPAPKRAQWVWERFCDKLVRDTAPFGNVFFAFMDEHSYDEGNGGDHFLRFFKERGALWCDWDDRQASVDLVMSPTLHDASKNPVVARGFAAEPVRPYIVLEGPPYQGDGARLNLWSTLLGGGHFIFHADEGQATRQTGIAGYDPNVPGGDPGMDKRDWVGHASRFLNEQVANLDALAPHNELCSEGALCLATPGKEYVAYVPIPHDGHVSLDLSGADGPARIRLHDPRSGRSVTSPAAQADDWLTIGLPDDGDWVVHCIIGEP